MDLRFAAFNRIYRDVTLRTLLVNHADRIDGRANLTPGGSAIETCFIALTWTASDQIHAPAESEFLTAHVHMPRRRWREQLYLDFVQQRLQAALTVGAASGVITARCLVASSEVMENGFDTIFKTSTFQISPTSTFQISPEPGRGRGAALLKLAPWTGCRDLGAAGGTAPSTAGTAAPNTAAPNSGMPSMN